MFPLLIGYSIVLLVCCLSLLALLFVRDKKMWNDYKKSAENLIRSYGLIRVRGKGDGGGGGGDAEI